jgi:glycosyltransferase involved in cell wall biosynthesis
MRALLFTPAAKTSAIARVSALLVRAIRDRGDDLVVVRSEEEPELGSPTHDFGGTLLDWTDDVRVRDAHQRSDVVVYQVGDNFRYHQGCMEWLPRLPGIVCLHDYFVGNLFLGWAERRGADVEAVVRRWYTDQVARDYAKLAGPGFVQRTAEAAPMTEWVSAMASGVITHSTWDVDRVLRACPGPVEVVPLPYEAVTSDPAPPDDPSTRPFTVLTVGYVNPNKRVSSVIRAIGDSDVLRTRARYRLVGFIDAGMREELESLSRQTGVAVQIDGEVDEATLRDAVAAADVVCCLRYPALESASASAIEAMLSGKPIVVIDTGFYRDLPNEFVRKISPEHEVAELRLVLEQLESNPDARRALGARAAEWAARTFRADRYADALARMARRVAASAPPIEAASYYTSILRRWGAAADSPVVDDLAEQLRVLGASSG